MNKTNLYQLNEDLNKAEAAAYEKLLRRVYGNDYNAVNTKGTNLLRVPEKQKNDAPVLYGDYPVSGFFSVGNAKLPNDTMVIDFTSAHGCPSIKFCPVSSLVCYAGRGEDRFKDKMRKNIEIEDLTKRLRDKWIKAGKLRDEQGYPIGGVSEYLELAKDLVVKKNTRYNAYIKKHPEELYKEERTPRSPTPVRYVRFNECGDFPDKHTLECAIKFSEDIKDTSKYGYYCLDESGNVTVSPVRCMAYTANRGIQDPELWKRAARSFAINASVDAVRNQLTTGDGEEKIVKREYNATHGSNFEMRDASLWLDDKIQACKDAEEMLATNPNETPISNEELAKLEGIPTGGTGETNALLFKVRASKTLPGDKSVPLLRKGEWSGSKGEEWYYVCPCTFWALLKDTLQRRWFEKKGYEIPMIAPKFEGEDPQPNYKKIKWKGDDKKEFKKYMSAFQNGSPCGTRCRVCHNMKGGRNIDNLDEVIYDYHVLSATHGGGAPLWNQSYYDTKKAEDSLTKNLRFSKYNKHGEALYGQTPTDAYFYGPLYQDKDGTLFYRDPEGNRWEKEDWEEHVKDEVKQMKKERYEDMLKRRKEEADTNKLRRDLEARVRANRGNQTTTEARSILRNFRSIMEAINRYDRQKKRNIFDW